MDTKQPNALRLADALGRAPKWQQLQAAAELRRQHAEIETLRKTNTAARGTDAQIIKERELCAYAFAGAVADGLSGGTGPDTQESEWLRPAFEAGQEIAQLRAEIDKLRKRECLRQISEPAPSEWDVRGHLAASLTCWHRLTNQEAAELVALFQGRPEQAGAPVVLPEPVAAQSRFADTPSDTWDSCSVEHARSFGGVGYEVRYLYTEQQVRAAIAAAQRAAAQTRK